MYKAFTDICWNTNQKLKNNTIQEYAPSKLDELQRKELLDHLQKTTYLQVKEICKYVKAKYGTDYSKSGMTFWLKDHEFTYKQPIKIPGKLDPEKQEAFIAAYETLKSSLSENEELYFMDPVHPEFQSKAACEWIKKRLKILETCSAFFPHPEFNNTVTLFALRSETARSGLPSPLKSPAAIVSGEEPIS